MGPRSCRGEWWINTCRRGGLLLLGSSTTLWLLLVVVGQTVAFVDSWSMQQMQQQQQQQSSFHVQPSFSNDCRSKLLVMKTTKITTIQESLGRRNGYSSINNDEKKNWMDDAGSWSDITRRRGIMTATLMIGALFGRFSNHDAAHAAMVDNNNALFKPNPLTNSFLEQVRIWEQAEADQLVYHGELERGDAGNKGQVEAYPRLLMPILIIAKELEQIQQDIVHSSKAKNDTYELATTILAQPKYETIAFKKIFNRFADNIYYSDPDRANLYLAGGATPKTEQSLAYLLRNEILTSVQDLKAELVYHEKHPDDEESQRDLVTFITAANAAMNQYLAIVPPQELARAQDLLRQQ